MILTQKGDHVHRRMHLMMGDRISPEQLYFWKRFANNYCYGGTLFSYHSTSLKARWKV